MNNNGLGHINKLKFVLSFIKNVDIKGNKKTRIKKLS